MSHERLGDWYAARVLFLSLIDGKPGPEPLYEERVVLIRATSSEEAEVKARRYGVREAHEYRNEKQETVSWALHVLVDVTRVPDELNDEGWEVASRFVSAAELSEEAEQA